MEAFPINFFPNGVYFLKEHICEVQIHREIQGKEKRTITGNHDILGHRFKLVHFDPATPNTFM